MIILPMLLQKIKAEGARPSTIPKAVEAEIFRTVPAWWWRTPRKAPQVPVHLITAKQSQFYKTGLTARDEKNLWN